jgi:serine/threonine protein kinase
MNHFLKIDFFFNFYRYPFNDSEHASLFAKISRGVYVVPECLSSKARCIIRALLRRDPDERITSEDILYHPWLKQDDDYREVINAKANVNSDDQCVPEWHGNSGYDEMNGVSEYEVN